MLWAFLHAFTAIMANDKRSSNNLYLECIGFVPILFISLCCFGAKWWYGVQPRSGLAPTLSLLKTPSFCISYIIYIELEVENEKLEYNQTRGFSSRTRVSWVPDKWLYHSHSMIMNQLMSNVIPSNERFFWEVDSSDRDRLHFPTYYSYFLRKQ